MLSQGKVPVNRGGASVEVYAAHPRFLPCGDEERRRFRPKPAADLIDLRVPQWYIPIHNHREMYRGGSSPERAPQVLRL